MSPVAVSRPTTQGSSRLPALPLIPHPMSSVMPGPAQIDVMGSQSVLRSSAGRPLAAEQDYKVPKRLSSMAGRIVSRQADGQLAEELRVHQTSRSEIIPEGVQVAHGDPAKPRMPIFGSKTSLENRQDLLSRASTRLSKVSTESRIEVDEIESILKERCRTYFNEVQKRFKDNDPQGLGNVTKEALHRIIMTVTGRSISQSLFNRLMQRIGFQEKTMVHFSDFFTKFRDVPNSAYPQWMTSINKNYNNRPVLNAVQVHTLLKEKAKQRVLDIADLFPQANPEGARRLQKPEFRNALNQLMFTMDDDQFEQLWQKYDSEDTGVIDGRKLMKKLGINVEESQTPDVLPALLTPSTPPEIIQSPRKRDMDRQRSLDIERWLKNKFREGFHMMKTSFEEIDSKKSGVISGPDFCTILSKHALKLEPAYLEEFLSRCGIRPSKKGVPYREFLHRFQDRSELGMPHKILGEPGHRYNKAASVTSESVKSTMSALEFQLMNMFQRDFLSLIGTFHKIDRLGTDVISKEEFRAAIESRFGIEMTDDQFFTLIDHVPLSNDGDVKYAEFMSQFDTRGETKTLFQGNSVIGSGPNGNEVNYDSLVLEEGGSEKRDIKNLFEIIRKLLITQSDEIEKSFSNMEEFNSQRLSQETLYQLLKKFNIEPHISRGEIRDLWRTLITNKDGKLEWAHFIRHFTLSKSAPFPNSKLNPPKRGDADFQVRSRKLNSDADLLQDSLRQKIDYMWDELRKEFFAMDPYGTGYVSQEEFRDILAELCVQLSESELNSLVNKFSAKDGRVSYIEFLRPFAMKREIWRSGNNMQELLRQPRQELPIAEIVSPPQKGLIGITAKLRQKLAGDWKTLRRTFRKLDKTGQGFLSLPDFRNVLKLANIILDEDEVYHVMNVFDEDLSGNVNYNKFLSETLRPDTKESQKK